MLAAALLAVAATVLATTFGTRPAGAAFPGENGKIVYEDLVLSTFDYEISVMNPDGSGRTNLTNDGGDEEKAPTIRPGLSRLRDLPANRGISEARSAGLEPATS